MTIPVGALPAADGAYPVTAQVTDAAGNTSTPSTAFNITLDRGTPGAPGALDLIASSDSGSSASDNYTNDSTPTITGLAVEAGATVTLYDTDGTTVLGTTVSDGSGNWSITPSAALTDGVHSFKTTQTDSSGNTSGLSAPLAVTIDTSSPSTPAAPDLTASSDAGVSNTDDYTNETTPEFAVSVPAGHTASLFVDGIEVLSALVAGVLTPTNPIADGPHTITYTVTDQAGNESGQSPSLAITIDTSAPSAPVINSIPENSGGGVTTAEQANGTVIRVDIPSNAKVGDQLLLDVGGQPVSYIIGAADIGAIANVPVSDAVLTVLGNNGVHPVTAQIIDQAGNVSAPSSSYPLVLTNAALTSPIVTAVPENNGGGINAAEASNGTFVTVDITGSKSFGGAVSLGDTLLVTINGVTADPVTLAVTTGPVSVFFTAGQLPPSDGIYNVTAVILENVTGKPGPVSPPFPITIDRTAPAAPGTPIDMTPGTDTGASNSDDNTQDATPDFAIVAPGPGETPSLYLDGGKVAANFDALTNTLTPINPLSDGPHTIRYTLTDAAGNESPHSTSSLAITIDSAAPSAPAAPDMTSATDSGASNTDNDTRDTTPDFTVSVPASHTATLYVDGVAVPATLVAGVLTPNNPLPDGAHSVTYTVTDLAGNESAQSPSLTISIDTTAPSAPVITAVPENSNGGVNAAEASDGTTIQVSIPADAKAGDTLTLTVGGQPPFTYTVLAGDVGATANVPVTAGLLAALPNGNVSVTTTLTDAAGNTSAPSAPFIFTLDTVVPSAPTALDLLASSDSGASSTDDNTSDNTPTITGAPVEAGATVTLYDTDGTTILGTTVADASGNWSINSSVLADGVHSFTVKQTDAAGNQGLASTALPVTIDTTKPVAPVAPDMTTATDSGTNSTDNSTNDTTPDFSVSVPASHTATLYVDGVAVPATLVGSVLTPTNPIADGAHTITYSVTDLAGNESTQSSSLAISIDTTAPTAPTITAAPENSNGGINAAEAISNNSAAVAGTDLQVSIPADAKAGDVLTLTFGSVGPTVTYTVTVGNVGATATVPVPKTTLDLLSDGNIAITATLTDAAGNTSVPSAPFDITLDRAAPSQIPPLPDLDAPSDTGSSSIDNITNDLTPSFSQPAGTAPADAAKVAVFVDASATPILVGVNPDGSFAFNSGVLAGGNHTITMAYVDAAGNTGAQSALLNFTIDTTAPSAPIAPDMTAGTDSGASNIDNATNDTTPTFTVAAPAAGEVPKLYIDGVLVLSTFNSGTNTLTPTNPIADGAHSVTTTITDVAGNESLQSPSLAITIDTTAPSAPSVTAVPENSNGGVNAAEASDGTIIQVAVASNAKVGDVLTLTLGTGGSQQTVTYTVVAGDIGATANVTVGAGNLSALPDGNVPVSATLTDAAGNTTAPSSPFSFLLDTTAPAKPTIIAVPENAGGGINANEGADGTTVNIALPAGTKAGDTIALTVGGNLVAYIVTATDEAGLTAAVPVSAAVLTSAVAPSGEGPVSLTATVSDAAGNVSATSDPFSIIVDLSRPGAPQITDVPDNTQGGISIAEAADGSIVNVDLFGTGAKAGDVIALDWGGTPVSYTLTATDITNGSAPVAISSGVINTRGSGTFNLTTTLTDSAGNVSAPSTPFTVKVDIVPPFAPTITAIPENDNGGINGTEAADGTNVIISLAGTGAEAGDKVHLTWDGQPVDYFLTPADILAGSASTAIPAGFFGPTHQGNIPIIVASIQDNVGNTGPDSAPFNVFVDTVKPTAPVIASIPESSGGIGKGEAADGTIVNVTLPSGTVTGDTVTLNFGGQIISYTVLAGDASSGSAPIFVSKAILETIAGGPNGTANNVPVTATVTDQAGNVSDPSANFPVNIDFTNPTAPSALDLTDASDTGALNNDNITSDDTPTITGAAVEPGATVTLYDSDGTTVLGTTVANALGTWSITPASALAPGVHTFTTKQTDTAGNTSVASTSLAVTILMGAPLPGTPDMTAGTDSGSLSVDNITFDTTPDFTISGVNGSTISVFADVNNDGIFNAGDIALGSAVVAGGVATITGSPALVAGNYNIRATQTDLGGNVSAASSPLAITIDTAPPSTVTPVLDLIAADDTGSSSTDNRTNKTAYTINATGLEPGATVQLKEGATVIATTTVTAGGTASFSVSSAAVGAHNYSVTQTDVAGNPSTTSTLLTVTVDTAAPAAPTPDLLAASDSGSSSIDNLTNNTTPVITGAAVEAGATVTLYDSDGTTILGTTVADGLGAWSITPSAALAPGVHNLTTKQTDTADNQGAASSALPVTIDTNGPSFSNPAAENEGFASTSLSSATLSGSDNVTAGGSLEVISAVFKSSSTFVAGDLSFGAPSGGAITMTRAGGVDKNGLVVVTVQMRDGAGNITTQDVTLTVNGVNDAPAGTNATITATEDTNFVFAASDFALTDTSDSPANLLQGVRITTIPGAGTLYNDANGNGAVDVGETITAGTTVAATDIAAGKLKFVAAPNANGTGYTNFTFQVQDDGGTANGGVNLDPSADTITLNVTAVNDAPTLDASKSPTLSTQEYVFSGGGDAGVHAPTGASPAGSLLVSSLVDLATPSGQVDNVTDVDTTPSLGMGITALSSGLGTTLWYTTNGGTTWNWTTNTSDSGGGKGLFGADGVAGGGDDRVLFLGADVSTKIIFDGGGSGTSASLANGISFRAWDQTAATAGSFATNPSTGGASSLSSAADTVQVNFTSQGIDLTRLEGGSGLVLTGVTANAKYGWDVSAAGDVNGDGFDDFIVSENGVAATDKGQAYLYYGQAAPLGSSTPTGQVLNGVTGSSAKFTRTTAGETMTGVTQLGDINNDGFADFMISGDSAATGNGSAYVIFGKSGGVASVASLDSTTAGGEWFRISAANSGVGRDNQTVSWAGDVNGDGFGDLIVGTPLSDGNQANSGTTFIVYGHAGKSFGPTNNLNLGTLANAAPETLSDTGGVAGHVFDAGTSTNGVLISGNNTANANLGNASSGLGDRNGDGYDDYFALLGGGSAAGANGYIGFGNLTTNSGGNILWAAGTTGSSTVGNGTGAAVNAARIRVTGPGAGTFPPTEPDRINSEGVGDINGDGLADMALSYNWLNNGDVYVNFGGTTTLNDAISITTLGSGTNGFKITGAGAGDRLGETIRSIGDFNGDGFDDIIVGAPRNEVGGATDQGAAYVIYGGSGLAGSTINLLTPLTGAQGLYIRGPVAGDQAGFSVASAGDVNGDGFDDLLIGAPLNDSGGVDTGLAYLIYGAANYGNSINSRTIAAFNGTGNTAAVETVIGTAGADSMTGSGIGAGDSASMGAGNDLIITNATTFQRIDGGTGNDTLRLNAAATWDFTSTSNLSGKVRSIEIIDLGTGNQTLRINAQDVLNMSETTNALRVTGTAGDTVDLSEVIGVAANQWHNMGTAVGVTTYQYFNASNVATLAQVLIDSTITTS